MCPLPPPRTRMTGVIPRRPQVCDRGGPSTGRTRLRRRSSRRGRRGASIRGQVSFFHTSTAPSSRSIPAAPIWQDQPPPLQQVPDSRDGVLHPELAGDQVADPGQRPPLVLPPGGQRPGLQRHIQRRQLPPIQPALRRLPARSQPLHAPPARQACRHRRTDRSLTRNSAAITADGTRCSNLLAASSRNCSRRLWPSAVRPSPCAYLMQPAYREAVHVSHGGHHQLKICIYDPERTLRDVDCDYTLLMFCPCTSSYS